MFKSINILLIITLIWIAGTSFIYDHLAELPKRKISKSIEKVWKTAEYQLQEMHKQNDHPCMNNGVFFEVVTKNELLGYVYSGRVNSCKSGGCSAETDAAELAFEYFDYYVLLNDNKQVVWVKIYNYQATQGHEVMSRGWLNQFKVMEPGESVIFGKDIEAISGATVSVSAITEDIQQVLMCM